MINKANNTFIIYSSEITAQSVVNGQFQSSNSGLLRGSLILILPVGHKTFADSENKRTKNDIKALSGKTRIMSHIS